MRKLSFDLLFKFFVIICFLNSCSEYDKSQISDIEKLSFPNKNIDVYLYSIESGMSFGSSVNALKIVKYKEEPDFYNSDFFRVSNSRPFQIKLNDNNLIIKTISTADKSVQKKQSAKIEIQNYNGFNIKNLVYTLSSTTALSEFKFDIFYERKGNLIFKDKKDSLILNVSNSQISIGSGNIEIRCFDQNKFAKDESLAFDSYKLIPPDNFDFKKLEKYQPLKKVEK